MKKNKTNFCCYNMEYYVNNYDNGKQLIEYNKSNRTYYFLIYAYPNGTHQVLWYCPWCGTKLPEELGELWDEILEKEYGITDPFDQEKDKVPTEFWTDEWWKKRGL